MHKLNRPEFPEQCHAAAQRFIADLPAGNTGRTEKQRWELFKNEQQEAYQAIRAILEQNQQGLCAFCETTLNKNNRQIEHFIPKSLTSTDEEWTIRLDNYLLTCDGNTSKSASDYSADPSHRANLTCGAKKENLDPRGRICNPYEDLPEEPIFAIEYRENGIKYIPDANVCAKYGIDPGLVESTIERLGLNCPSLQRRRKAAWDDLLRHEDAFYANRDSRQTRMTPEDFKNDELRPQQGKLPSFITLRRLFFQ